MSQGGAALDRLAELEDERRFLLRSLADLEREHQAGDIDEQDYVTLRDGYTARAATVLRAIEKGTAALPQRRRWRPRAVVAWLVGTLLVASIAGVAVARSSGQRLPGETSTGGPGRDDVAALLVQARQVMASEDPVRANLIYERVLELDPGNVEATAYTGWLFFVLAENAGDDAAALAVERAKATLREATVIDPTYADPHCFLALIALLYDGDATAAQEEITACFANDPPVDLRRFVEQQVALLAEGGSPPGQ